MGTRSPATQSSSPASFYTENDSEMHGSTTASSPTQAGPWPYREARRLPRELKDHCQIFLEEQIYECAINLLNSTLGAGFSRPGPAAAPRAVPVPPPSHIALLGTLVVHPLHTTRADKAEHRVVSSLALDYLRNLLAVAGPINAGFRAGFQFYSAPRWGRHASHGSDSDASDGDSECGADRLRGRMANEVSVWSRGQDLWSTVGWALNTATMHPHRWRYWKAWLELVLDVLDADWAERERLDHEAHEASGKRGDEPFASRAKSMMHMYMDAHGGRQTGHKRIVKALLADGGRLSTSAFPPVFEKEPGGPKKASRKRKWEQALDLENGKFGDYLDDSISSGVSEPPTPERRGRMSRAPLGCSSPGLVESVPLRLRLFRLLSAATHVLGRQSDLDRLYEDFAAAIKVLPLPLFALLVSQRKNPLLAETHATILKELFHLLFPLRYRDPRSVDPHGDATGSLTMPMLENCYVSSPANSVGLEDDAKLSLVVESAIQLLWICNMIRYTDSFAEAAERGIEAREAKARKRCTGKMCVEGSDVVAQAILAGSAERIRVLLQLLAASANAEEGKE